MPNAAIAAQTYQAGLKNADPIGSYLAGIQVRTSLQRVDLAQEAQRNNDLFTMVKLGLEREEQAAKTDLAKQQLEISKFNAQTNRINAERAVQKSTGGNGGGAGIMPVVSYDDNGHPVISFSPATPNDAQPTAQPTGQDGDGVLPLQSGGPTMPSLLPTGGAAGVPPEGMSLPTMPGQAPRSAPAGGIGGYITGGSTNLKTGSTTVNYATKDPNAPEPVYTEETMKKIGTTAAFYGAAVMPSKADEKGNITGIFFAPLPKEDKLTGKFTLQAMPEKVQTSMTDSLTAIHDLANKINDPTTAEEKAKAMGLDPATDKNAYRTMAEGNKWSDAYEKAMGNRKGALLAAADDWARNFNNQFREGNAYPAGFVPMTAGTVLEMAGAGATQPAVPAVPGQIPMRGAANAPQAPAPQATPTAAPQSTNAPAGKPAASQSAAPAKSAGPAGAPSEPDTQGQITALENEIATETNPTVKRQKENFLAALKQKQPATAPKGKEAATAAAEQDPWNMPPKAETAAPDAKKPQRDEAVRNWEESKAKVARALKATLTAKQIAELEQGDAPSDPERGGGNSSYGKKSEWLQAHAKDLGIEAKDGKPLRMDSPIFTDHEGRTIYMREILRAVYADPRFKASTRESTSQTKAGNAFTVSVGKTTEVK